MEDTTSGSTSATSEATTEVRMTALSQFVYDYLIELGLQDQAQLLKDFIGGEASTAYGRIAGQLVTDYWVIKLMAAAKISPIVISRDELGPRLYPINPSPMPANFHEELTVKIKVLNQLAYEYLKVVDVSTIANDFKGHVQRIEANGFNFSQLPLLHRWLDIVDEISFVDAPWGDLGPILPDIIPLPNFANVGLEWEFEAPHPDSGDIGVDDYIESPDSQSRADVPSSFTTHPSSFPDFL